MAIVSFAQEPVNRRYAAREAFSRSLGRKFFGTIPSYASARSRATEYGFWKTAKPRRGLPQIGLAPASRSASQLRIGTAAAMGTTSSRGSPRKRRIAHPNMLQYHSCSAKVKQVVARIPSPLRSFFDHYQATAVEVFLFCKFSRQDEDVQDRAVKLVLSCFACISELCTLITAKSESLFKLMLFTFYNAASAPVPIPYLSTFKTVLDKSRPTALPCCYGGVCGVVDFPCVNLGLCNCALRPVYSCIFYGNLDLLRLLLLYGAEIKGSDVCFCNAEYQTHPLVRVYDSLSFAVMNLVSKDAFPSNATRCHQLAALTLPVESVVLRDACFSFLKSISTEDDYDRILESTADLQHLCRFQVRRTLIKCRQMPGGVGKLPVPDVVKRYLLFGCSEEMVAV